MIEVLRVHPDLLDSFLSNSPRNYLEYQEYSMINFEQLVLYYKNKTVRIANLEGSVSRIAMLDKKPIGLINVIKERFDSEIFGFDCYRITDLLIASNDQKMISNVLNHLIQDIINSIKTTSSVFHLFVGINNNLPNASMIVNELVYKKFTYIHTLLTFSNQGMNTSWLSVKKDSKLNIREAVSDDVRHISALAQKGFKYSRFHLDPYLNNTKANELLQKSAENSIIEKFVDIMFVAEYESKVIGYYSAKKRRIYDLGITLGEATISAVDSDFRGLGVFSHLNSNLLDWFSKNTDLAEMGTYLINFPVHRTWIKCQLPLIRGTHQLSFFFNN